MSFDRLTPHYTWLERVLAGPRLQRARVAWVHELAPNLAHEAPERFRVLIAGVGHGHFLRACARRFPHVEIVSVDASARMLEQARARALHAGIPRERLQFVQASLPEWQPPAQSFDAIVTHFFLDCFPPGELADVVATLAHSARGTARWLLADFAVPARGWRRARAQTIHRAMYAFFRPVAQVQARRVTQPDPLLRAHGFTLLGRKTSEWGLLQSDLWTRAAPGAARP